MKTLFVLLSLIVAPAAQWERLYTVTGAAQLRIDAPEANVIIRAWDEATISARISGSDADPVAGQEGDRVTIALPQLKGWRTPQLEVKVPRRVRLQLNIQEGSIEVADTEGAVTARTNGATIVIHAGLDELDLRSGTAAIKVEAQEGSVVKLPWRIESKSGNVTLTFVPALAATLDLRAKGGIHTAMPIQSEKRKGQSLQGTLNGGGPLLTIRAGEGAIQLLSR